MHFRYRYVVRLKNHVSYLHICFPVYRDVRQSANRQAKFVEIAQLQRPVLFRLEQRWKRIAVLARKEKRAKTEDRQKSERVGKPTPSEALLLLFAA